MRILPILAAVASLAAAPAFAQTATVTPPDAAALAAEAAADSITIGAGGVYLPDYEGSNDYRFTPAPAALVSYKGFGLTVAGNRAALDVIPDQSPSGIDIQAGPIAVVNFNRSSLKSIDDLRVRRLGELGTAIELGGYIGIGKTGIITSPYDKLSFSLSYRVDVNGVHKGGILQPTVSYFTPLSRKAAVGLFVSGEHTGDRYANTYFTVSNAQALASGLPAYRARGGWKNYTLGAVATVSLTGDLFHGLKLVGGGTYGRLLNDYGDSPITSVAGKRSQWLGALGLAYTF